MGDKRDMITSSKEKTQKKSKNNKQVTSPTALVPRNNTWEILDARDMFYSSFFSTKHSV